MERHVVIIGGGPGGATLGCYLSKAGIKNTILERAVFPRPHVGESMVPSTTRIFKDIGFLPVMEREGFVRKFGASWHPVKGHSSLCIEFKEFPQEGVDQEYTYHVDRSRFDTLLLKHAESLGSQVHQGVRVKQVLFDGDKAVGVQVNVGGKDEEIPADIVVDASGRHTVLGTQLSLKEKDTNFNQFAVHGWFNGVDRGARPDDIHIHFLPCKRGWVWQIPITEETTSIGVVAEREVFLQGKRDHAAWFKELSHSAPDIADAMRNASPVNDLTVEADYSYSMRTFVGNGWMLIGDAARFVDPIFSSGMSVAMYSAKFASERILKALESGDTSRAVLEPYETRLKMGTSIWYEFILLYYKLLPVFTHFIVKEDYRMQVLQLLQGEVYDRQEAPVLKAMREFIAKVEAKEGHLLSGAVDRELMIDLEKASMS